MTITATFEKDSIMRGKYKNRAENKAAERSTEQKLADQDRLIAKLQTENAELIEKLQIATQTNSQEITRLRNELHEAVSPELKAAREQIAACKDELGRVRLMAANRLMDGQILCNHLLGMWQEANDSHKIPDSVMSIFGRTSDDFKRVGKAFGWERPPAKEHRGQRVRGFSTEPIAKILRSLA